jgi:hypothetical protein
MAREMTLSQNRWAEKDCSSWGTLAGGLNAAMNGEHMYLVSLIMPSPDNTQKRITRSKPGGAAGLSSCLLTIKEDWGEKRLLTQPGKYRIVTKDRTIAWLKASKNG